MKTLKMFLAFAFVAFATSVSAEQRVENQSAVPAADTSNGWDRVFVSYNASSMMLDYKGAENISFPGFSLGYMKGFSVSKNLPLFVEAGAALQFRSHKDEYNEDAEDNGYYGVDGTFTYTEKMNFFSLNIPVNFVYKWQINDEFSVDPFIGVDFRINLTGKNKESLKYSGEDAETINEDEAYDESLNMFSKDDWGDPCKRFQAGWHIGVGANYKAFNLSISYGSDFNEIMEKRKFATTVISLGYNF